MIKEITAYINNYLQELSDWLIIRLKEQARRDPGLTFQS